MKAVKKTNVYRVNGMAFLNYNDAHEYIASIGKRITHTETIKHGKIINHIIHLVTI